MNMRLLQLPCAHKSPAELVETQVLQLRCCTSDELRGRLMLLGLRLAGGEPIGVRCLEEGLVHSEGWGQRC